MKNRIEVAGRDPSEWRLAHAVLVYKGPSGEAYATRHEVMGNGKNLGLGAGIPATKAACADLARALGAASSLSGFTPANLVYMGPKSVAWWRPPGPARMFFNTRKGPADDQVDDKKQAKLIGHRGAITPQPGLVFAITGGKWFVYALDGAERPAPGTRLMRAPYFNVWETGQICTGTTPLPKTLSPSSLDSYERAFFGSNFTHPNVNRLVRHKAGVYAFWRAGLDGVWGEKFPVNALVETKLTLTSLAARLEKEKA